MRHLRIVVVVLALLVLSAPSAFAQTATATWPANTSYTLSWDHDNVATDGFKVYVDGVHLLTVAQTGATTYTSPRLPALAIGAHTIVIAAYNAEFETASDPLVVTVQRGAPGKPQNTRMNK